MDVKHGKWLLVVAFMVCFSFIMPQVSAKTNWVDFTDVPRDKPYSSAIYDLAERNIIGGNEDGTFKPEASFTRGQAAAIIAKLLKLDTKNAKDPGFTDVSPKLWSYGAIAAVSENGIFRGYADGRFGPNDQITRAQMASILIKAFNFHYYSYSYLSTPFKDIERLASHQDSVLTLYKLGITSGTSKTTFSPNQPISRAQAAVLISKTEKVRNNIILLHANKFGWKNLGYSDYHNRSLAPEQNEEEIIQVITNKKANSVLQIVPMREGTQKLVLGGRTKENESAEYKKYYVHVRKENGQLVMDFEETEDVLPTNARLNVKKEQIKNVTLSTMDGTIMNEHIAFHTCKEYLGFNQICIPLTEQGEYIANVEYVDNTKVRYGISALLEPSDFYLNTYSIEEVSAVTMDLSKDQGDFSEYKILGNDANIVKVTREENTDKFHIEGFSEGQVFIDFPNSDRTKEGTLGLTVNVKKIGFIFKVEAYRYDYYSQFY